MKHHFHLCLPTPMEPGAKSSLFDLISVSYDIVQHVLAEHQEDGQIFMSHSKPQSCIQLTIKSTKIAANAAVDALVKLRLFNLKK